MSKKAKIDTSTLEQSLEVETQEIDKVETTVESKQTLSKDKTFEIQNVKLANSSTKIANGILLEFDSNGITTVNGDVATRLMKCGNNFKVVKK